MGKLNPNVVKSLVNFKEYSDMRKLLCEVLSFTLLPDQIRDLRKEFEKMDTDGSGEISFSSLKKMLLQNAGDGMLGALTEREIQDIFNAMRVRKSEATIHWHEFIAAGLSQCKVDDRNLRLAFDRLDSHHKGFITLDDVLDLMGCDATEDSLREMYTDSLKDCQCQHSSISYEDFLLLMKGQKRTSGSSDHATTASHHRKENVVTKTTGGSKNLIPTLDEKAEHDSPGLALHSLEPTSSVTIAPVASVDVTPERLFCAKDDPDVNSLEMPLSANRELYRNHRRIRLAVLEASKRFEDQQISRLKQQLKANGLFGVEGKNIDSGAGLVLRRGHEKNKELWNETEAVRKILQEKQEKEQKQLERVKRRAGRGRRTRKKTVSDMSAMMSSPLSGEEKRLLIFDKTPLGRMGELAPIISSPIREERIKDDAINSIDQLNGSVRLKGSTSESAIYKLDENVL